MLKFLINACKYLDDDSYEESFKKLLPKNITYNLSKTKSKKTISLIDNNNVSDNINLFLVFDISYNNRYTCYFKFENGGFINITNEKNLNRIYSSYKILKTHNLTEEDIYSKLIDTINDIYDFEDYWGLTLSNTEKNLLAGLYSEEILNPETVNLYENYFNKENKNINEKLDLLKLFNRYDEVEEKEIKNILNIFRNDLLLFYDFTFDFLNNLKEKNDNDNRLLIVNENYILSGSNLFILKDKQIKLFDINSLYFVNKYFFNENIKKKEKILSNSIDSIYSKNIYLLLNSKKEDNIKLLIKKLSDSIAYYITPEELKNEEHYLKYIYQCYNNFLIKKERNKINDILNKDMVSIKDKIKNKI